MKRSEIEVRLKILAEIAKRVHGSGIDRQWMFIGWKDKHSFCLKTDRWETLFTFNVVDSSTKALTLWNSFHCMDQHGGYCGWADFTVVFPMNKPLDEYRIRFHGADAQRLQKKYDIREYIDQCIIGALHDVQQEWEALHPANQEQI